MPASSLQSSKSDAYPQAIDLLHRCLTVDGFLASPSQQDNYRRIWARDGVIISLAALLTDDIELIRACKNTLKTLARYQGPYGEIPSNVDTVTDRVSYGGTTGRVDAGLWFIIGCAEYWMATGDDSFIEEMLPTLEKSRFLLGAWEFNSRGLIYVPQAGDWADEYLHAGYVLYDQLLYLQAQRSLYRIHTHIQQTDDHRFLERIAHLKHLIQDNYWFNDESPGDNIYHEVLYEKGLQAAESCINNYWLPFFAPTGYGYRFDAFANILVSLFDVANEAQSEHVDSFIAGITPDEICLVPAFYPVIKPEDKDWKELQMIFSYSFKNNPYEFQNGGLWPMLTGFYVADLAQRGKQQIAENYLKGIDTANMMAYHKQEWSFPEYINGKNFTPGGTLMQGWSAAATLIGQHCLQGKTLFRIDGND